MIEIEWDDDVTLEAYRPLYETDATINLVWGGRDGGKSYNIAHPLVEKSLENPTFKCLLIRNVYNTVKDSVYAEVKGSIESFGLEKVYHSTKSPLEILCTNGSSFLGRGCDEIKKIKSVKEPSDAWIEEANEITKDDFDVILTSLRNQELPPTIWLSFNPETNSDGVSWIKDYFFTDEDGNMMDEDLMYAKNHVFYIDTEVDGKPHRIKVLSIHTDFDDNEYATDDRKAAIESNKGVDQNKYQVWRWGYWGRRSTGTEWFSNFDRDKHVKELYLDKKKPTLNFDKDFPLHISYDQNNRPYMSGLCIQSDDKSKPDTHIIRIIDEICLSHPRNSTEEVNREVINRFSPQGLYRVFYYGDSTGKSEKAKISKSDMRHHYEQVEKQLSRFIVNTSKRVVRKNPSLIKTRDFCIQIFGGYYEDVKIYIDPKCKNLIQDLENLKEDSNGGYKKPVKKDKDTGVTYETMGHLADCLRYFLVMYFKSKFDRL